MTAIIKPLNTNMAVQSVMQAMTVSIFANSLGMLMAATPLTQSPSESQYGELGLASLREAFGNDAVTRAVARALPDTDIVSLAMATEAIVLEDLHKKYTDSEINAAMTSCPAGDFRCVKEVCNALHNKGIAVTSDPVAAKATADKKADQYKKLKSEHTRVMIKDTQTGIIYRSINEVGKKFAAEYGVPPSNFAGFPVITKAKGRFVRV